MKRIFLSFVCAFMLLMPVMASQPSVSVPVSEDDDYALCVRDFMKLSNTRETFTTTLAVTYVQMKDNLGLTASECEELAAGIVDVIYDDLVELSIPIYKKYYTYEDMCQLCDFMRTPTGKKFAKNTANVSTEIMNVMPQLQEKMQSFVIKFMENKQK